MILLDVAVCYPGFMGSNNDRLHIDHTFAQLLERLLWQPSKAGDLSSLFQILEMKLGDTSFKLIDKLDWFDIAYFDPENI